MLRQLVVNYEAEEHCNNQVHLQCKTVQNSFISRPTLNRTISLVTGGIKEHLSVYRACMIDSRLEGKSVDRLSIS